MRERFQILPYHRPDGALVRSRAHGFLPCLLLGLLCLQPAGASAQAAPDEHRREVGGWIAAEAALGELAGEGAVLAGGRAGISIGPRVRLGGGGYTLLGEVAVGVGSAAAAELRLGYGGVTAAYGRALSSRLGLATGILLGGGSARVRDPVVGVELGSDNFLVAQPEVEIHLTLPAHFTLAAAGGYRLVGGVQDLPGVASSDLDGPFASFSVVFGAIFRR